MKKFIYKNKKTGKKIHSDKKLNSDELELIRVFGNTKMPDNKIIKK